MSAGLRILLTASSGTRSPMAAHPRRGQWPARASAVVSQAQAIIRRLPIMLA